MKVGELREECKRMQALGNTHVALTVPRICKGRSTRLLPANPFGQHLKSVQAEVMGPTNDWKGTVVRAECAQILAYFDTLEASGVMVDGATV